jgi:hypothetical protein
MCKQSHIFHRERLRIKVPPGFPRQRELEAQASQRVGTERRLRAVIVPPDQPEDQRLQRGHVAACRQAGEADRDEVEVLVTVTPRS